MSPSVDCITVSIVVATKYNDFSTDITQTQIRIEWYDVIGKIIHDSPHAALPIVCAASIILIAHYNDGKIAGIGRELVGDGA